MSQKTRQTIEEGFNKFVIKNGNGCWGWNGAVSEGYGQFRSMMKRYRAHRASWIIHHGEIPNGMLICHKCDNRLCSNPQHLFLGNMFDNMHDCIKKHRHPYLGKSGEDNHMSQLTWEKVKKIRELLENQVLKQKEIAFFFNINPSHVSAIKLNKIWRVS